MRIAVASQGLDVASKVLRCASYMCYRVDRGMIVDCQNMPNLSLPPAQLATLMKDLGVTVMLAQTVEPSARAALEQAGIEVETGSTGTASRAARTYLAHTLAGRDEELEAS